MKHVVIVAHPRRRSLSMSMAQTYARRVRALGHQVVLRDLYRMNFDPSLKPHEIPAPGGFRFDPDVVAERKVLGDAHVYAFVYPLWFNGPPAMMKGYVDRVFSMGFGFRPAFGGTEPMLGGKRMISFTTSGATDEWVRETGSLAALMSLFDRHLSAMCGLELIDHVHFGGIVPEITSEAYADILSRVRGATDKHVRAEAPRRLKRLKLSEPVEAAKLAVGASDA